VLTLLFGLGWPFGMQMREAGATQAGSTPTTRFRSLTQRSSRRMEAATGTTSPQRIVVNLGRASRHAM